jgi:hypothetical protein
LVVSIASINATKRAQANRKKGFYTIPPSMRWILYSAAKNFDLLIKFKIKIKKLKAYSG